MATPFDAPIPGQSLTDEPGNAPWEKPAEINTVEDTIVHYIKLLADQDVMDDLAVIFDAGMTLKPFVKTMVQTGTMQGIHTVDVGLLVQPTLIAFLKGAMETYGITVKEESLNKSEKSAIREKQRTMTAIKLAMAEAKTKGKTSENDAGVRMMEEMQSVEQGAPTEEAVVVEEPAMKQEQPAAPQGAGLMARGE
tara:strand:+ start:136 stop:717 length:582 start_codon:yes stop_codon:yes gene_type:complete